MYRSFRLVSLLCAIATATSSLHAEEHPLQELFRESTVALVKIDTAALATPQNQTGLDRVPDALKRRLMPMANGLFGQLKQQANQQVVHGVVSLPVSQSDSPLQIVRNIAPNEPRGQEQMQERLKSWQLIGNMQIRIDGDHVIVGKAPDAGASSEQQDQFADQLNKTLQHVSDQPIQIAIVPPTYLRETFAQMMPKLPKSFGGGPTSVLTDGIRSVSIGADPSSMRLEIRIESLNAEAAQRLKLQMPPILQALYRNVDQVNGRLSEDLVMKAINRLPSTVEGNTLMMRWQGETVDPVYFELLSATVDSAFGIQRSFDITKQFRQIGLAIHNYHSAFKFLPPWKPSNGSSKADAVAKHSNIGLSWRVHILPFMEQVELYQQFHLDEPWDSEHNKTLIEKMPRVYAGTTREIPAGHTTILAPSLNDAAINTHSPTSFRDVTDGLSNTVIVLEANASVAVPWTAPRDYKFSEESPLKDVQMDKAGRWNVLFGDGSTKTLPRSIDLGIVNGLFTRNGKEIVRMP